jgi:hypothetical protein
LNFKEFEKESAMKMSNGEMTNMTNEDFKLVRGLLRWTGLGVLPTPSNAESVIAVINNAKTELLNSVSGVFEEIRRGVMVSQTACKDAESRLVEVFEQQMSQMSNTERNTEVDR